jgi:hypothetical protein
MRQAQHASVLPYLYISLNANDRTGVRLLLTNSGIGPALVDEVHIRYQGRDFNGDPYDFILAQRPDIAKMRIGVDKVQTGRLIPAGATIQMVDLGPAVGQKVLPDVLRLFEIAEVPRACTPRSAPQARTRRWSKSRTSPCTAIDGGSGRIGSCRKGCERIGLES